MSIRIIFLLTLVVSFMNAALAQIPTFPTTPNESVTVSCDIVEDPDWGDCYGDTYLNGESTRFKKIKRKIRKQIRQARRARKSALRDGDTATADAKTTEINTWKEIRTAAKSCNNYYDETCSEGSGGSGGSEGGGSNSGGSGNTDLAQACTDAGGTAQSRSLNGSGINARIINGAVCTQGSSSWVGIYNNGSQHCTGNIVAPNIIITAAHCVADSNCGSLTVRDGLGNEATATSCDYHPSYSFPNYDLAFITLDSNLSGTPISIASTASLESGAKVLIAGFGRNENETGANIANGAMLASYAYISSTTEQHINTEFDINDSIVDGNSCNGDSGGGLAILIDAVWYLVGVVSGGSAQNCGMLLGGEDGTDDSFWTNLTSSWAQTYIAQRGVQTVTP